MSQIWMRVSADRYSLPEAIASTCQELADICGTTTNTIYSTMSKYRSGDIKSERYIKIEIEEETE